MSSITLTSVALATHPTQNMTVNIKIRKTSDPDIAASYTNVGDFVVLPNGSFYEPVVIDDLLAGTSYTIWTTNTCSNSSITEDFVTSALYYNVEKSGLATKNDCVGETDGSTENYVVPAGEYTSVVSQEAADALAQADVDANKQDYANDIGECVPRALVRYSMSQYVGPYIDANMQFQIGEALVEPPGYIYTNQVGSIYVKAGTALTAVAFNSDINSGGIDPKLRLQWLKEDISIYDHAIDNVYDARFDHTVILESGKTYDAIVTSYDDDGGGEVPTCPERIVVIQICNSNSQKDDNFNIELNGIIIGNVDLNSNSQVGSILIASEDPSIEVVSADFVCPLVGMQVFRFNPALLQASNTIRMINTQSNDNGNYGTVGIRNYLKTGNELSSPCVIGDLTYSGPTGSSFDLEFGYTACCPEDGFLSERRSGIFTKDNCPEGTTGTPQEFVAEAGLFSSLISQEDANTQAENYVEELGQADINSTGECFTESTLGSLLIDYYDDADADLCLYVKTVGLDETGLIVAATGNGGPLLRPNDGTIPAACSLLSSDRLSGPPARRFGINLAYFLEKYAATQPHIDFEVRGRSATAHLNNGHYVLRDITMGQWIMSDYLSDGKIPAIPTPDTSGFVAYSTNVIAGGDGQVGLAVGNPILTLRYTFATNAVTHTVY